MAKVRQDAWTHENDLLLAETVLRHIRQGGTQLNAFEEVGDRLNRTSAACGFRWNAEVRQNYEQAVAIAKRQRKQNKREQLRQHTEQTNKSELYQSKITTDDKNSHQTNQQSESKSIDLDQVINYLVELQHQHLNSSQQEANYDQLESEHQQLMKENQQLKKQIKSLEKQVETIQEDYQAFLQIMDRARKMVVFEDDDDNKKLPTFVMDKNGNLEQVAR